MSEETGELDIFDEIAPMYRPKGSCAKCGEHPATEVWWYRVGSQAFSFRCHCCMAKGRLERALEYQKRIPKLEKALAEAEAQCGDGKLAG